MTRILKSFSVAAIVIFTFVACTGTQVTPMPAEPTVEEVRSEPTATVMPTREEPAAAPDMLWSAAFGTDSAEKVQRGIETADGGILAIGNIDEFDTVVHVQLLHQICPMTRYGVRADRQNICNIAICYELFCTINNPFITFENSCCLSTCCIRTSIRLS